MHIIKQKLKLTLCFACAACACAASAQDLSGQWRDDRLGYRFHVEQKGDRMRMVADELFRVANYADMEPGDVVGEGVLTDGKFVGRSLFFSHATAQRKCGKPAKELSGKMVLEVDPDGARMRGTDTIRDMSGVGCQTTTRVLQTSATRVPGAASVQNAATAPAAPAALWR
jgi:hypothetical protein